MTWPRKPLAELLELSVGGVWGKAPGVDEVDVRVARVTELRPGGRLDFSTAAQRSITKRQLATRKLRCGDLLLEKSGGGPRTPVGRVGLVTETGNPTICANFMQLLRPDKRLIEARFLHLYLNFFHLVGWTEPMQTASTNIRNIKATEYVRSSVPVPQMPEQRRIVEILEDHLSHLDAANAELSTALARLDGMRAALLSSARTGPMTALSEVADIQGGIQKQPRRAPRESAYPFLRVANVTAAGLDLQNIHQIELFGDELSRLRLVTGDLLVVEGNGSPSQIGRAALWDGSIKDCVHQNHLIRVRARSGLQPEYLEAVWNSPEARAELTAVASSSSGLHTLSVAKLKRISLPIPTPAEQRRIVDRLGEDREARRRLAAAVRDAQGRALSLRKAVLAAAFSGKLTGRHTDQEVIEELAT